jgi:hypothetical protein
MSPRILGGAAAVIVIPRHLHRAPAPISFVGARFLPARPHYRRPGVADKRSLPIVASMPAVISRQILPNAFSPRFRSPTAHQPDEQEALGY